MTTHEKRRRWWRSAAWITFAIIILAMVFIAIHPEAQPAHEISSQGHITPVAAHVNATTATTTKRIK